MGPNKFRASYKITNHLYISSPQIRPISQFTKTKSKVAEFHIASLSIAVTSLTLLSFAAAKKTELATQVCKTTTDFNFCRSAVYSDPRAATADRYELINIVYRKAYLNATDTRDYIATNVKSGGTESESLKKCLRDYNKAIQKLKEMLGNLNDESYYQLNVYSLAVEKSVRNCRNVLHKGSVIWGKDENMMKPANICYVVLNFLSIMTKV